jgi:hypothetical protein
MILVSPDLQRNRAWLDIERRLIIKIGSYGVEAGEFTIHHLQVREPGKLVVCFSLNPKA